jgi:two-component system, chemotaxis family, chemotaxis protein CheY
LPFPRSLRAWTHRGNTPRSTPAWRALFPGLCWSPMDDKRTSESGGPGRALPAGPPECSHRILVVDDDSETRRRYGFVLAPAGYHVDGAADGAAGWEALQTNHYQLLITEQEMPNLTGMELIKKLRAARMALPVVMAARRLPVEELAEDPSLQLAATLSKPFLANALLDTVKTVLSVIDGAPEKIKPLPARQSQPSADALWLR